MISEVMDGSADCSVTFTSIFAAHHERTVRLAFLLCGDPDEPMGLATLDRDGGDSVWRPGSDIAWLIGDGRRLWLAGPPGDAVLVSEDVATITVSPALAG